MNDNYSNELMAPPSPIVEQQALTMWNSKDIRKDCWEAAKFLSESDLVPTLYQTKPANCLIALDIANRTGLSPLTVMQQLYIVEGKPSWSGQMCIALINASRRYTPLDFVWVGEKGQDNYGCYAKAIRLSDKKECCSDVVTIAMAKSEGWWSKKDKYGKERSKWQSFPNQMAMYRAGAFFGRTFCPDVLLGLPLSDEIIDIQQAPQHNVSNALLNALEDETPL